VKLMVSADNKTICENCMQNMVLYTDVLCFLVGAFHRLFYKRELLCVRERERERKRPPLAR